MVNKKQKGHDPSWNHCSRVSDKNRMHLKCNYCGKEFWGGVIRMKNHLACTHKDVGPCTQVGEEVKSLFLAMLKEKQVQQNDITSIECFDEGVGSQKKRSIGSFMIKEKSENQQTLNQMVKKRETVIRDICRFVYGCALSFNLVKSPLFTQMLKSVGEYGKGLKPPTYYEARVSYLKKEVEHVHQDLEEFRKEWKKTGCTLMSDGWTDGKHRSITNFLVNSPRDTVFIRSLDTSSIIKSSFKMYELLNGLVEEIGEENVVQVITDSASSYVGAGELLMDERKKLVWSPCAAHLIDLMLSDIGDLPVFKDTIDKAKKVTTFIYRHVWVLDLFRKYSKQRDLTRPGVTRFATSFLTLKSFHDQKIPLRSMFASEEWETSTHSSSTMGKMSQEIILEDARFWKSIKYCIQCVLPLVKVLRLVDGDTKPAMGYIYEALDRAKEEIATNFNNVESRYKHIWAIIDERWELQLHSPLHAAGYYLNPRFHYDAKFNPDREVKTGLYKTIEKMYPDVESKVKIDEQLEKFKKAEGMFGMSMAVLTRDKKQPALWWESYGEDCPELQRLAIRVLSLTCSATGCERNWSTFDLVHSKRRNRLEQQRLNSLVFVKYNIQLQMRHLKRQEQGETYDPICLSAMESDNEWITEKEDPCLPEDHSWMDIQECFQDEEILSGRKRKRGPRVLNQDKKRKRKGKEKENEKLVLEDEDELIEDDAFDDEEGNLNEDVMVDDVDDDDDDDDNGIDLYLDLDFGDDGH